MSTQNEESEESARRPQSISHLARVEVEEPARKMRLMFGEKQVVFIRSDGLRSRVVRENMKKKLSQEIEKKEDLDTDSPNLTKVIDDVASGATGSSSLPSSSTESYSTSSSSSSSSSDLNSAYSSTSEPQATSSSAPESSTNSSASPEIKGNRNYHPPREFHGASTMVSHKRRWTYQTACDINAAEQSGDSEMYYIAHPLLPMPRGSGRNEVSTATRMNYAGQRIDNRKFRGQSKAVNQFANTESVTCEKCGMRYFFESIQMQERISYLLPPNEEDLPIALFECPVCKITTKVK